MADEFDRAQELDEKLRAASEEAQREKAGLLEVQPCGHCLNCNATMLVKDQRWCDADCRDDWEIRTKTRHFFRR